MTRLRPSDPLYEHVDALSSRLAMLTSPAVWFDVCHAAEEVGEAERNAAITVARGRLETMLEFVDRVRV